MNVVFFMSDSYRYDNLSCYGPTKTHTPRLDAFAGQAHVFENAYLGSFPTVPNRLDIMSGRFSCIEYQWQPLPREVLTFQEILTASGITTQLIADTPHILGEGFNYSRGWMGWEWIRARNPEGIKVHYRNTAWWCGEEDRFVARTVGAACDWLDNACRAPERKPFFLYVDTFDPHEPWDAPRLHGREPQLPCLWLLAGGHVGAGAAAHQRRVPGRGDDGRSLVWRVAR